MPTPVLSRSHARRTAAKQMRATGTLKQPRGSYGDRQRNIRAPKSVSRKKASSRSGRAPAAGVQNRRQTQAY